MKYISATINKSIYIIRSDNPTIKLDVYADAGHLTHHDMKGHTGVLLTFNDNFIIAISKKQSIFSESTCESELYAAHSGGLLSKWIVNICQELNIRIDLPITYDYIAHQYTIRHNYYPPTKFSRNIDGLYILSRSSIPHPKSSHI